MQLSLQPGRNDSALEVVRLDEYLVMCSNE